jgi:hypothetical protein
MKIRSLLLGSAAAAGLATGAYAADPLTMTALDTCDALGKTGLTISSDTDCVQISGEVKYEFNWGDYKGAFLVAQVAHAGGAGTAFTVADNDGVAGTELDWDSKLEWYIKLVATADSDGGPVSATIKIKEVQQWQVQNEAYIAGKANPWGIDGGDADVLPDLVAGTGGDHTFFPIADEAYVSIGDGTVIMLGKKGSIINKGDDEPFNFLGLFNSEKVDKGVYWSSNAPGAFNDGGHVIQVTSDLGNGVAVGVGAENLQGAGAMAGTLVGVLSYAGDGITAHITGVAGGFLDGTVERFAIHTGFTGTFDTVKVRAALAADNSGYFNALATAEVTFDMFKLAVAGEAATGGDFGVGGSITATVADGVTINVGGRYYDDGANVADGYQVAAQVAAMVTETIKLTAEGGVYGNVTTGATNPYVAAEVAYAPGGNASVSAKGEFYADGAIKGTVKGSKSF